MPSPPHLKCFTPPLLDIIKVSPWYKAVPENITSLLLSVLLRVCGMSNNANGNKQVIFCGIAWFYGDNYVIMGNFDFIAHSDTHT